MKWGLGLLLSATCLMGAITSSNAQDLIEEAVVVNDAPATVEVVVPDATAEVAVVPVEAEAEAEAEVVPAEPVEKQVEYDRESFNYFLRNKATAVTKDPVVIEMIKRQNKRHGDLTLGDIQILDQRWRAGDASVINPVMDNVLSDRLKRIVAKYDGVFTEFFVLDNKGLNVGQSFETSDYWQGDEAKYQKTFVGSKGRVFVDDPEYDESMGFVNISASLPVLDKDGTLIGVVVMGVNPDKIN